MKKEKIHWTRIQVNHLGFSLSKYYKAKGCPTIHYIGYGYCVYGLTDYGYRSDYILFNNLREAKEFAENLYMEN